MDFALRRFRRVCCKNGVCLPTRAVTGEVEAAEPSAAEPKLVFYSVDPTQWEIPLWSEQSLMQVCPLLEPSRSPEPGCSCVELVLLGPA